MNTRDDAPASLGVIVHSLEQALAAASVAAEFGATLILDTAPGAAGYAGVGWFVALVAQVRERYPELVIDPILDCADEAGTLMAAFRRGLRHVRFAGPSIALSRLEAIAASYRAVIETSPSTALDLLGRADPAAGCRLLLAGRTRQLTNKG